MLNPDSHAGRLAVVLVGHGAPATNCPPRLVGELMSLEWRNSNSHHQDAEEGRKTEDPLKRRAAELDAKIRGWPRHSGNDPYKTGLEQLAETLKPLLPTDLFAVAYNEFCRPSIAEAIDGVIQKGAARVLVIPTMLTPGGVHSEVDIPRALELVRRSHPQVAIEYVWPFDLSQVARLLAAHINRATKLSR